MASVLLVRDGSLSIAGDLTALGHTVTDTTATSGAGGLDTAWGAGKDLIIIASTVSTTAQAWVAAKWAAGVPCIFGGWWTGSASLGVYYGLATSETEQNISGASITITGGAHPVTTGLTGSVAVATGTFYSNRLVANVKGTTLGTYSGNAMLSAVEVGDALNTGGSHPGSPGATAPARAVYAGWLQRSATATTDGQTVLGQAVSWVIAGTPPSGVTVTAPLLAVTIAVPAPTITVPVTGVTVAAPLLNVVLAVPTPVVSIGPTSLNLGNHTSTSSMVIGFATEIPLTHTATSSHTIDAISKVAPLFLDHLSGGSRMEIFSAAAPPNDPLTGKPAYRLVVVTREGVRLCDLNDVVAGPYSQDLNDGSTLDFTIKRSDPKIAELKIAIREVQLWRGNVLEDWMVLTRARTNGDGTVTFSLNSLDWYLTRRVIGKVPIPNLLKNGSFEEGEKYWNFTWVEGSIPQAAPIHSIETADINILNGTRSLRIEGSSAVQVTTTTLEGDVNFAFDDYTLTTAGNAAVDAFANSIPVANPVIHVVGHTDSTGSSGYNYTLGLNRAATVRTRILATKPAAVITTASFGETRPVASNATSGGRAANRRVDIDYSFTQTAKGHRQYAGQSFVFNNPLTAKKAKTLTLVGWTRILQYLGPAKDGWGVYMQLVDPTLVGSKQIIATGSVSINSDTPKERWTRMECSLEVPANGKDYRVDVRLYPPEGVCVWDEIGVTASDELAFYDVDQALIIKGIIEHIQDEDMGKSDLNLDTFTPLTGRTRERVFPWVERMTALEALSDFPTLADGLDLCWQFTPTTRTMQTYYPRRSRTPDYAFIYGGNVVDVTVDIDGFQTTSQVIVQAEGDGSDREEGVYTDTSLVEGVIFETVYNATPGSSVSSLVSQAKRGIKRWAKPVILPELIMDPTITTELLRSVELGDVMPVRIDDGWLNIDGLFRITGRDLDLLTDQITYRIAPEVDLT